MWQSTSSTIVELPQTHTNKSWDIQSALKNQDRTAPRAAGRPMTQHLIWPSKAPSKEKILGVVVGQGSLRVQNKQEKAKRTWYVMICSLCGQQFGCQAASLRWTLHWRGQCQQLRGLPPVCGSFEYLWVFFSLRDTWYCQSKPQNELTSSHTASLGHRPLCILEVALLQSPVRILRIEVRLFRDLLERELEACGINHGDTTVVF